MPKREELLPTTKLDMLTVEAIEMSDRIFEELKEEVGIRNPNDDSFFFWTEELDNSGSISEGTKDYVRHLLENSEAPEAKVVYLSV